MTNISKANSLLLYVDHLQKQNANDLAFYPLTTLESALEENRVLTCSDNEDTAGYLWHGPIRSGWDIVIYQACVDYDSRRRHLGFGMVKELLQLGIAGGSIGIRLRSASSSEANEFWRLIGFYCTKVSDGGVKRRRKINHWRTDIQTPLFRGEEVVPSTVPIDLRAYQKEKRDGVVMPSKWSRSHYK